MSSADTINQRYSLEGLADLSGWDEAERRKVEGQRAEQAKVIGGLAVASHGLDRYLPWHLPWTGPLGSGVTQVAEEWGLRDAADAAKVTGWDLGKQPAGFASGGTWFPAPGFAFIVRPPNQALGTDRPTLLGRCKDTYQIISNEHALDALESLTATGQAKAETIGWLDGGKRVFCSMRVGDTRFVLGDDPHELYLAFILDHSGMGAARCITTAVRMHCANTVRLGERNTEGVLTIAHRGDVSRSLDDAARQLLAAQGYYDEYTLQAQRLAEVEVTLDGFERLAAELYPEPQGEATERSRNFARNRQADVATVFKGSRSLDGVPRNGWRAYNAVTEYEQWVRGAAPPKRLNAVWEAEGRVSEKARRTASLLLRGRS